MMFCRDTRHLSPEEARKVWIQARILRAALSDGVTAIDGWTIAGAIFEPEKGQSDAARRLARYRAFGCGGSAGRENFREGERGQADEMLRVLLRVAQSDPDFRALVGPEAHAERRRVWSV
jgi:imidazolonepropionase-like amidohydrolase